MESVLSSLSSSPPLETLGIARTCMFCSLRGALSRVLQQRLPTSVALPVFPGGQLSLQRHRPSSVAIQTFLEVTGCPGSSVCKYIKDANIIHYKWMPWPGREVIRWSPTFIECFNPQPLHSPVGGSAVIGQITAPLLQASSYRQVHGEAPRAQPSLRHNQHWEGGPHPADRVVSPPAGQVGEPVPATPQQPPHPRHPPADPPTFSPARTNRKLSLPCVFLGGSRHGEVSRTMVCLQPGVHVSVLVHTRLTLV